MNATMNAKTKSVWVIATPEELRELADVLERKLKPAGPTGIAVVVLKGDNVNIQFMALRDLFEPKIRPAKKKKK